MPIKNISIRYGSHLNGHPFEAGPDGEHCKHCGMFRGAHEIRDFTPIRDLVPEAGETPIKPGWSDPK